MSAEKNRRSTKKSFRLELSKMAVVGWGVGLLLALLWMFLLGLLVGKGLTPANINLAEIKRRMVAEGLWPGSGKPAPEPGKPAAPGAAEEKIPIKDLEFYEALARKKQARLTTPAPEKVPEQKTVTTPPTPVSTVPAPPPPPPAQPEKVSAGPENASAARYTVQIASFKEQASAEKFAASLKHVKSPLSVHPVDLPGKGRWYRVQAGGPLGRQDAEALAARLLREQQVKAFVVRADE
ncbi:MAG TPA: SPOR domain-containing protein [Syntrophobacteria bacterium]|nr:SPOR domain-containing protein [Syntrophobacteria bacterium]